MAGSVRRAKKRAKREEDEIDRLEKENRELKAINRSLLKQLKKLAKGINKEEIEQTLEKLEENGPKEEIHRRKQRECPECARSGGFGEITIAGRRFEKCELCGYRSGRIK